MKQEKKNRNLMENIGLNFNNLLSRKFIGEPLKKITEKFPYKEISVIFFSLLVFNTCAT